MLGVWLPHLLCTYCKYLTLFNYQRMYIFVIEKDKLDWYSCQICYPFEIKLLLLLLLLLLLEILGEAVRIIRKLIITETVTGTTCVCS